MIDSRLIPECNFNTVMLEVLGFKNPNHIQGCSNVVNKLGEKGYNNNIGIGVLDEDKPRRQGKKLKEQYVQIKRTGRLTIKQMPDTKRYIILHPISEKWIWEMAQERGINFGKHNYESFKARCKPDKAQNDPGLREFLNKLKQADTEFTQLGREINMLLGRRSSLL